MDWQQTAALAIVAVTIGAFTWSALRPKRIGSRKGSVCGCGSTPPSGPKPGVIYHARKGERPTITVKMN